MWFIVWCTLTDNEYVSLLVSQTFFTYRFCIVQRVHFQVRVGVFSCQDKYLFRYLWYCGKKKNKKKTKTKKHTHTQKQQQIECGLAWSVLLSTMMRVITVVKMLCASWVLNKLSCITKRALCFSYWVHPWANSRCWIGQSECALFFSYVTIVLGHYLLLEDHSFPQLHGHILGLNTQWKHRFKAGLL